ncbi:hypothetical protein NQ317_012652 [Molorchus minor]|uniref:Uncharacterized protein n=1 Tax=Molorchus minor TaxID=1323400 RepID=A0ABQ9J141_9CUCU|nr:hypothetical protein NQ317_012652 [Molorchus minor]
METTKCQWSICRTEKIECRHIHQIKELSKNEILRMAIRSYVYLFNCQKIFTCNLPSSRNITDNFFEVTNVFC